jgi:hypothetical protein
VTAISFAVVAVFETDKGGGGVFHAAALSSLSGPRATILILLSDSGRCSALASSRSARGQTSRSSSDSRMTGMALGLIGSTTIEPAFETLYRVRVAQAGRGAGYDALPFCRLPAHASGDLRSHCISGLANPRGGSVRTLLELGLKTKG